MRFLRMKNWYRFGLIAFAFAGISLRLVHAQTPVVLTLLLQT